MEEKFAQKRDDRFTDLIFIGSSIGFVDKKARAGSGVPRRLRSLLGILPLLRLGASAEKPAKLPCAASNAFFYLASFGSPRVRSLAHAPLTVRLSATVERL